MNIKPIGSISILDVEASEIPAVLAAWILAFNVEWLDVSNEEHIINPYTEVSETELNRIEHPDWRAKYLDVINSKIYAKFLIASTSD